MQSGYCSRYSDGLLAAKRLLNLGCSVKEYAVRVL